MGTVDAESKAVFLRLNEVVLKWIVAELQYHIFESAIVFLDQSDYFVCLSEAIIFWPRFTNIS